MLLSLLLDLLALLALHILLIYAAARALYASMLHLGGGLWRVFRGKLSSFFLCFLFPRSFSCLRTGYSTRLGKRYNALRNRTDTWEYDIDQLLLGTVLFTLLAFLFPTVLAYYALFALVSCLVLYTCIICEVKL